MNATLLSYFETETLNRGLGLLDERHQRGFKRELLEDGRLRLSARYPDRFNFVDRAQLILSADGEGIDSARCDCAGRNAVSFCSHCAALLLRLQQEEPAVVSSDAREEIGSGPAPVTLAVPELLSDEPGEPGPSIHDLTYCFTNCPQHLYPDIEKPEIPLERFEMVFGSNMLARKLHRLRGKWTGSCFGMSASSGLFYHPGNDVSVPDYRRSAHIPAELELTDWNRSLGMSLHTFIEAVHISQLGLDVALRKEATLKLSLQERLKSLCEQVEAFENQGTAPVVMEMFKFQQTPSGKRVVCGHAVLPFRLERQDRLRSRLHIYDPNRPGEIRYCELRQDRAGNYLSWRFLMDDDVNEFSSENGCEISYLSYEIYQKAWDQRKAPRETVLFTTGCADLSLQDAEGNEVLQISGGKMKSLREDVVPVRVSDGEDGAPLECWVDPGSYRVVNEDPDQPLCFSFTSQKGELEVETEAEEAEVCVDDDEEVLKVELVESEKNRGKKILVHILTMVKDIAIKVLTSAAGAKLASIAGKFVLDLVSSDQVQEFRVDGEEADVRDYLSSGTAEELEEPAAFRESETDEEDEEVLLYANKPAAPKAPAEPKEAAEP